jgi:GTPase SAR1 family protein
MKFLSQDLQKYRSRVDELVKDLHNLSILIGHEELKQTLSELRNRINEPFMFVIVGEVKAGKSSFINALLDTGQEICKVSPAPMTDTIQQILYGENEETVFITKHLKKLYYPIDILKEIAIVDTPGTNTIIAEHQHITENFIPASDLIVFVFEAKNPYRQSAWDFLDFIHTEWRRKVIFVLQQKDLMSAEDLAINEKGVSEYAQKKGIVSPLIFSVSAKDELEGKTYESCYVPLREYIRHNITGGKAPLLKLENNIETSINITERIAKGLDERKAQFNADTDFRKDIRHTLDNQQLKSEKQVDILVENLLAGFDKITQRTERELDNQLSFFTLFAQTFKSIFSKKDSPKNRLQDLLTNLETELSADLRNRLNSGVNDIADSIQQMAKMIDLKIKTSQTILKDDHDIFADIAERRTHILRDLQEAFASFLNRTENFTSADLFDENKAIAPNIATGSGLAVVGIVLAVVTKGMVLDVTGGILTGIGILFAGVTMGVSRNKILKGYRTEIEKGRAKMEEEVNDKLKTYISTIKRKIESNFLSFDAMLENEKQQIEILDTTFKGIDERLQILKQEVGGLTN